MNRRVIKYIKNNLGQNSSNLTIKSHENLNIFFLMNKFFKNN